MLGNSPVVSVLIAAYNHERFVQETIRSIMAQTYKNIELIIIDDGSKDSTWSKIQDLLPECEKRFVRVVAQTQINIGCALTLNKLIGYAQGKYIYTMASDDLAKPMAIEKQVRFLEEHPDYVLVVGDNELIDGQGQRISWNKHRKSLPYDKGKYKTFAQFLHLQNYGENFGSYQSLLKGNYIPNGYLSLARGLKSIPPFNSSAPLEDWFMHLQMSKLGKYGYVNEILFSYRWHGNNTAKNQKNMKDMTVKTFLYEKNLVKQKGYEKWNKIFEEKAIQTKIKFSFGKIIKLYKVKSIEDKQTILEIFKRKIIISG